MFHHTYYDWTMRACHLLFRISLVFIKGTKWHRNALRCCKKSIDRRMELLVMKSVGRTPSCWITRYDTLMEGLVFLITVEHSHMSINDFYAILPTLRLQLIWYIHAAITPCTQDFFCSGLVLSSDITKLLKRRMDYQSLTCYTRQQKSSHKNKLIIYPFIIETLRQVDAKTTHVGTVRRCCSKMLLSS